MSLDLALVMPVYNEEACIMDVIKSWNLMLSNLDIKYQLIILNDGSNDRTEDALKLFVHESKIRIINKKNSGHGPTILMGYQEAVSIADWVFQCDSDDEMKPDFFPYLWKNRWKFDALFGKREGRNQNLARKLISACARITVYLFYGNGVTDVNTPYRLIRSNILKQIIKQIPVNTFAPNVIISGALSKAKLRIYESAILHENRRTGKISIAKWRLCKFAIKSFWQTLLCHPIISDETTE